MEFVELEPQSCRRHNATPGDRLSPTEPPLSDRREVLVSITESGIVLLDQIAKPLQECHATQLSHLTAPELKSLVQLLKKAREPHEPEASHWQ